MAVPVMKEYECAEHGTFASDEKEASCPYKCGADVTRVFLTAPRMKSDRTKRQDMMTRGQADAFGLTDLNPGQKYGEAAIKRKPATGNESFFGQMDPRLVKTDKPGEYDIAKSLAALKLQQGDAFTPIRNLLGGSLSTTVMGRDDRKLPT